MVRIIPSVRCPLLALLLSCSSIILAQTPTPRLGGSIVDGPRAVLQGSRAPWAQNGKDDLGPVRPDMVIPGITLVFKRSAAQQQDLQALIAAQQDKASPLFHHWLSPDTFAARFGIADADIAATEGWLRSHGFQFAGVSRSKDRLTFSGTAANVRAAFGAELRFYSVHGERHFAPSSDLTLPAELARVTAAILHLTDVRPKPAYSVNTAPRPAFTAASSQAHYLGPDDILTMYDLSGGYQGQMGGGQGLAIVGQSFVDTGSSSKIFQFQENLTQGLSISPVLVPGSGVEDISLGDQGESQIDLEYSSGIAQNANIFFVFVGANQNYSVLDALDFAITQNIAPVISISYGVCESLLSSTDLDQGNAMFQQAAAQGQTLIASAGDSGSTACAVYSASQGVTTAQQQALAVSYPASSPYFTAVGGTQMAAGTFTAGSSQYWATASGFDNTRSLLSYVPEDTWNEGSATHGIIAGGGGSSGHYPRPTWQSGAPGIVSGPFRLLPDISLQASIEHPGFLVCTDDRALYASQGQTSSCSDGLTGSNNQYTLAGGTSFSAPIFAGMVAILNQAEHATGQGNINPMLYSLASTPASYASIFHDITSGTNACVTGAANCAAPGISGFAAIPGYDEATGLGSIDASNLIAAWPATPAATLQGIDVLIIAPLTSAAPATSIPIQIVVGPLYFPGGNSLPTGSVSISVDGVMQPTLALAVLNASEYQTGVNYNFIAPSVPGSHLLTVTYPGDSAHAAATSTYSVLVGTVTATGSFNLAAPSLSVATGSTGSTQVGITPSGGYSGRIVWGLSVASSATALSACYNIDSPVVNGVGTTKLTIGIGSACNSPLPAAKGAFRPLERAASQKAAHLTPLPPDRIALGAGIFLCVFLCRKGRRSHFKSLVAVFFLLAVADAGLTGCGGSSNSSTVAPPPVVAGTNYSLTLTGSDSIESGIVASTTFTLTVH